MNWEELVKARDDQTPLVWTENVLLVGHCEVVTVDMMAHRGEHEVLGGVWVARLGARGGDHRVRARTEDLRIATAQDLLELGEL